MITDIAASISQIATQTQANLPLILKILALLWGTYFLNLILGNRLLLLGIYPRHPIGLPGIILAPILHANFNHLFFNSIPLVVFSDFLLIYGQDYFFNVSILITIISGTLIWCFGKRGLHIGASALITGYWAILVMNIYHSSSLTTIIIGVLSLYYFIGIIGGIVPTRRDISWEGHLFGLVSGIIVNLWLVPPPVSNLH